MPSGDELVIITEKERQTERQVGEKKARERKKVNMASINFKGKFSKKVITETTRFNNEKCEDCH